MLKKQRFTANAMENWGLSGKYKVCWSGSETKAYIDSAVQICHGEARTANAGREKYEDMYAQNGHDTQRRMVNDVWR